ncbi:MAG: PepSY-like domain-containing protein [Dysgonomonas sp.]|jgi:hypothetical protein|uniref:PepSY-like domain-containing protein n=1 Tax=Dysgonomonas sp. TaxID=1891233 RepID=UPI002816C28E|nr:PepSY-like domain-containing protein [Prevotella sp.]
MRIYLVLSILLVSCTTKVSAFPPLQNGNHIPEKIQAFLDRHFSKYEMDKLKHDAKGGECKVKYKNGIKIQFNGNGDWEEIESDYTPLPKSIIDILPKPAITYIAKNHPQKTIVRVKHKSYGYRVKLADEPELDFNQTGNLIKVSH